QFDGLIKMGVRPENVFITGKPYSTSRAAYVELAARGVMMDDTSWRFPHADLKHNYAYEDRMRRAASHQLLNAAERLDELGKSAWLLILDDGGLFIEAASRSDSLEGRRVVAVEQTTGGIHRLARVGTVRFPVISVAQSFPKLAREAPYIAESIIGELFGRIRRLDPTIPPEQRHYLVVGYGSVGAWTARLLRDRGVKPAVYDINNDKLSIAAADHFAISDDLAAL